MLTLLGRVLDDAVKQGTLSRNVAKLVERPNRQEGHEDMDRGAGGDLPRGCGGRPAQCRLAAQLVRPSPRRGARTVLVRYDLDAKTIRIRKARVEVTGVGVVEGEPKTERGKRTLPLDDALASALRSLKAGQARDRLRPGRLTQQAVPIVAESILW